MKYCDQLIFCSRPSFDFSREDLLNIMVSAQEKNNHEQLSGLLIFHRHKFIQLIEGSDNKVDGLFAKIQRDPRHTGIKTLFYQSSPTRVLPTWVMASSSVLLQSTQPSDKEFFVSMDEAQNICRTLPDNMQKIFDRFFSGKDPVET